MGAQEASCSRKVAQPAPTHFSSLPTMAVTKLAVALLLSCPALSAAAPTEKNSTLNANTTVQALGLGLGISARQRVWERWRSRPRRVCGGRRVAAGPSPRIETMLASVPHTALE